MRFRTRVSTVVLGVALSALAVACAESPAGPGDVCVTSVKPLQFSPCHLAGTLQLGITAVRSCSWSATSNAPWLTISEGAAGTGSGTVVAMHSANYDAPRLGSLTVRGLGAGGEQSVSVSQAGCRYGVSPAALNVAATQGGGQFMVVQQTDPIECGGPLQNACIWTATATVPWITITTPMPRTGDNPVSFSVTANDQAAPRVGTIVVRSQMVQVTQAAR